jgi:hypothetical protein
MLPDRLFTVLQASAGRAAAVACPARLGAPARCAACSRSPAPALLQGRRRRLCPARRARGCAAAGAAAAAQAPAHGAGHGAGGEEGHGTLQHEDHDAAYDPDNALHRVLHRAFHAVGLAQLAEALEHDTRVSIALVALIAVAGAASAAAGARPRASLPAASQNDVTVPGRHGRPGLRAALAGTAAPCKMWQMSQSPARRCDPLCGLRAGGPRAWRGVRQGLQEAGVAGERARSRAAAPLFRRGRGEPAGGRASATCAAQARWRPARRPWRRAARFAATAAVYVLAGVPEALDLCFNLTAGRIDTHVLMALAVLGTLVIGSALEVGRPPAGARAPKP